ncbi:MAG: Glutamate 5-kinase / RNA-binding C-terminal domain PUA [uncultured Quadrisphaera sp.]|uniref:Glutamate 5-kinase n=1 Tax=uncultured Quadrisphaera sp. TaxID=904978 RepID=A0A6J4QBA2_9ACTN|nr:MAG: Glutamate 5-kinase / RNA-binding C-terminal domain PUA [uncultured Quadrisphaera sp.]
MAPDPVLARAALATARRVVVKVGSSSLTTPAGDLDEHRLGALVDVLAARRAAGTEVVLVSSGAIASGLAPLGLRRRPRDLATQQAAASVGQGLLLARYTEAAARHGLTVGQVLLTSDDVVRRVHYANAQRTLFRLLALGVVPVVNENDTVATAEIRFGDNDRLAALVAHLVQADALVLLTDVRALHDAPPGRAGSRRVGLVDGADGWAALAGYDLGDVGSRVGTGGMVTKVEAARLATGAAVAAALAAADDAAAALAGEDVGTFFAPTGPRASARALWLAHAAEASGVLVLDDGAVRAVTERGASLLPAGVVGVEGSFDAGEPVDLVDGTGHTIARGLVNYSSAEVPGLLGKSTRDLATTSEQWDRRHRPELVHRDQMVLTSPAVQGQVPSRRDG